MFTIPQDILRTLTFINTADEPAMVQRSVVVSVTTPSDTRTCSVLVSVQLVNDNVPVVDLSGPLEPFTNLSLVLDYNFISQASVWVSSRDATISDADADGRIEMLLIDLTPGFPNDGLYLVGCPVDDSSVCHLR